MTIPPVELTELEQDALTELVNIGVSRAAASLAKMVKGQVLLSVPSVEVLSPKAAAVFVSLGGATELVAVCQDFEGDLTGRALLVFPERSSLALVRAITGGDMPVEEIIDLEQEALAETGNVILNALLGTIGNLLIRRLTISLPAVMRGLGSEIFDQAAGSAFQEPILLLRINFSVREQEIQGYLAMMMNVPSLAGLKVLLNEFIRRVAGDIVEATH